LAAEAELVALERMEMRKAEEALALAVFMPFHQM